MFTAQPASGVMTVASQATLPQVEHLETPPQREAGLCTSANRCPVAWRHIHAESTANQVEPLGTDVFFPETRGGNLRLKTKWRKGRDGATLSLKGSGLVYVLDRLFIVITHVTEQQNYQLHPVQETLKKTVWGDRMERLSWAHARPSY